MRIGIRRTVAWGLAWLAAGALLWSGAAPAYAHGEPAELAFWGNFGRSTTRCQRQISKTAASCIQSVLTVRSACAAARLAGDPCDDADVAAQIDAIKRQARGRLGLCTSIQLQNLRYLNLEDAVNDVITACDQTDVAALSAVYGPATVGGSVGAVDSTTERCIAATAGASGKLLRYAIRSRQRAFDRIAAKNVSPSVKLALVQRSDSQIRRAAAALEERIEAACGTRAFEALYGRTIGTFLDQIAQRSDCASSRVYVQKRIVCPAAVCGNGMQEPGEECDDGNEFDGDGCRRDCKKVSCDTFPTTYDLIQRAIFENRGCTNDACHGAARSGGLDLRAGASYQSLIDVGATSVPGMKRIEPGDKARSLLWINLAALTRPDEYEAPLRGMPIGLDPLTNDELEAVRLWIEEGGATREASIPRTAELLSGCLPEPRPAKIEPLLPPLPGEGIQMYMPNWTLPPKSESEVCFSSYYDFTGQIPAQFLTQDGTHFRYRKLDIRQDPLSHHLIVDLYRGPEAPDDPVWGPYSCKGGTRNGARCNPLDLNFCGSGSACATDPDPTTIACIGFGAQTGFSTLVGGGLAFAQETTAEFQFPHGVYSEMPIKGVVLWNSHAFNLTRFTGTLQAWVNIYFPEPDEQIYRSQQIFNASRIFWSESFPPFPLPQLPPFEQMEVCGLHTFGENVGFTGSYLPRDRTAHLFEVSGHMHRHGKRFQILKGRFTCKGGPNAGKACSPFNPDLCPEAVCTDDGGRDPQSALLYTNLIYNDPVVLRLDPPLTFSGSAPLADRTLTYCGLYDNGSPPNIHDVKRFSKSPPPGSLFGIPVGGPCPRGKTYCIGGPQHGKVCSGNNAVCDSSPDAGDGDCDACALTGGFRTEDEMFILFGNYWLQ